MRGGRAGSGAVGGVAKQMSWLVGCRRWWCGAARLTAVGCLAGGGWQSAERVERGGELCGPGPVGWEPQGWSSSAVDDPAGDREEPCADGAGNDQLLVDADVAADRGPADQVVRENRALQPHRIGVEVPRWHVFEPDAFFEIADRQLDNGVMSVKLSIPPLDGHLV